MKKYALALMMLLSFALSSISQSVGVGTNTPNSSAILDISSTSKGVLLPRMTTAQRDAVVNPAIGLIIFNTDDQCTDVYNGTSWIKNCGFKQSGNVTIPADTWIARRALSGPERSLATSFVINDKAYIGTGVGVSGDLKDLWEYNPLTNSWNQKADFAGLQRHGAASFAIGTKGYIGTGFSGDYFTDFWEYDAILNIWTQKAIFAGSPREGATGFSIGSKGYFACGKGFTIGSLRKDLWEYDPALDTWIQKADLPGPLRLYPSSFTIAGKGYVGLGTIGIGNPVSDWNDMWEYDPATNSWAGKAPLPASSRAFSAAFATSSKGFIAGGYKRAEFRYFNDFWEFDPVLNSWTQKTNYPYSTKGAVGFALGNKGYIGLGSLDDIPNSQLWEYTTTSEQTAVFTPNINLTSTQFYDGIWEKNINEIASPGRIIVFDPLTTTIQGNVGIGITKPNAPLQFANTAVNRKIVLFDENNNDYQFNGFGINIDAIRYQVAGTTADHAFFAGTSATTSNELFRIKGNGNVGIGTSFPNAPLQLANTAVNRKIVLYDVNNNDHQFSGFGINSDAVRYQTASTTTDHAFYAGASSTTSNELFRIKGNGFVGIGNSNPLVPLAFNSVVGNKIAFYTASATSQYGIGVQSGELQIYTDVPGAAITFGSGSSGASFSERMRINNFGTDGMVLSGRILIKNGTGLPTDVPGVWTYKADNSALLGFMGTQNNTNMGFFSGISNQWGLVFDAANMRVGIGTSTPSQALHVAGNILATGTITPSDARYKKNILLIDHPLEKLQQLNGVTYNYRQDEFPDMKFPDATQVGLIAQEVEKVFPQLVFTDDKGYKAVDYVKLIPLLIESLKAEHQQHAEDRKRLEALENKLNELTKQK